MMSRQCLSSLRARLAGCGGAVSLSDARGWLIECGALESAAMDLIDGPDDGNGHSADERAWREVTMAAARVCVTRAHEAPAHRDVQEMYHAIEALLCRDVPDRLDVKAPEGYAYYSLYPDSYMQTAATMGATFDRASRVCVVGVRSIGTSLSAIVAAALAPHVACVRTWTVRPIGHPFDRVLRLPAKTASAWQGFPDAIWIVVDEGPGLSGSTMASVASWLLAHGVAAHRVILMPHHAADVTRFHEAIAHVWTRVRVCPAPMEQWHGIGGEVWGAGTAARSVGGGEWRRGAQWSRGTRPLVHPHHERAKWRTDDDGWIKFVGLGWMGDRASARARELAEAGWGAPVAAYGDGLLRTDHIHGASPEPAADPALVDWAARYLTWISHERRMYGDAAAAYRRLTDAAIGTTAEVLDDAAASRLAHRVEAVRAQAARRPIAMLDARLFPHELVRTSDGRVVTVDGFEHGDDHFLPGPCDVLWDAAMFTHEFRLGRVDRRRLYEGLPAATRGFSELQAVYSSAYLAFRAAYTTWAARALGDSGDGPAFAAASRAYARALGQSIE